LLQHNKKPSLRWAFTALKRMELQVLARSF
jgi:hypothetical protein